MFAEVKSDFTPLNKFFFYVKLKSHNARSVTNCEDFIPYVRPCFVLQSFLTGGVPQYLLLTVP